MLLVDSGVETDPEALAPQVYLPERQGSLQLELVAATRRAGRLPYVLPPDTVAIEAALAAGHPVLVLQNLGSARWPRWHYAVVVGREARGGWLLRSGQTFRERMPDRRFRAVWARAGRWALVTLRPGDIPAYATAPAYLDAAAGLEAVGRLDEAEVAYRAAIERWPDAFAAHLGLGNLAYARGERLAAREHYLRATTVAPAHPAGWNNLATVLGELGCRDQALEALARGEAVASPAFSQALAETRRTLEALPADVCRFPQVVTPVSGSPRDMPP
jgi:tetratricopeptide (TPR) repeat protein